MIELTRARRLHAALKRLPATKRAALVLHDLEPARLEMAAALGATPVDARGQDVVQHVAAGTGQEGVALTVDAVGTAIQVKALAQAARRTLRRQTPKHAIAGAPNEL